MTMELKPVVIAKEGVAKIGNDVIELMDKTVNMFYTNDIRAFISFLLFYLTTMAENTKSTVGIFYDSSSLTLKEIINPCKGIEPIAACMFETDPILLMIKSIIDKKMSLDTLDEFLFILRPFYDGTETQELYDRIQKFSMKKLESITREKDRRGNFVYACSIKDEEGAPEFPATISFKCPVFKNITESKIRIPLELFIDFHKDDDDHPVVLFTLKNPLFEMQVEERKRDIIESFISDMDGIQKFYGSLQTHEKTDSWKYQINKIS